MGDQERKFTRRNLLKWVAALSGIAAVSPLIDVLPIPQKISAGSAAPQPPCDSDKVPVGFSELKTNYSPLASNGPYERYDVRQIQISGVDNNLPASWARRTPNPNEAVIFDQQLQQLRGQDFRRRLQQEGNGQTAAEVSLLHLDEHGLPMTREVISYFPLPPGKGTIFALRIPFGSVDNFSSRSGAVGQMPDTIYKELDIQLWQELDCGMHYFKHYQPPPIPVEFRGIPT